MTRRLTAALLLALAPPMALADCPPLSAYSVAGMSADAVPLPDALRLLFDGTTWTANVKGDAAGLRLSYRGVSGPLDQVLARAMQQAGQAAGRPLSAVTDPTRCMVTVSVPAPTRAAPPAPTAPTTAWLPSVDAEAQRLDQAAPAPVRAPVSRVLHSGDNLSAAVGKFVAQQGWQVRWLIPDDYVLDADITLPSSDVIEAVTWLVRLYQAQGALEGVVPRFARGNHIVVIEAMDVRNP